MDTFRRFTINLQLFFGRLQLQGALRLTMIVTLYGRDEVSAAPHRTWRGVVNDGWTQRSVHHHACLHAMIQE